jgi:hypothetical protein
MTGPAATGQFAVEHRVARADEVGDLRAELIAAPKSGLDMCGKGPWNHCKALAGLGRRMRRLIVSVMREGLAGYRHTVFINSTLQAATCGGCYTRKCAMLPKFARSAGARCRLSTCLEFFAA